MQMNTRAAAAGFALIAWLVVIAITDTQTGAQPRLNLLSGVQFSWSTVASNTYQPQWSFNPGGPWAALGGLVTGDGLTRSHFDPVPSRTRAYRILEMVPGSAPVIALPPNGGFEAGSGTIASNWSVTTAAGGPVYGVRTNSNPRSGSVHFEVN